MMVPSVWHRKILKKKTKHATLLLLLCMLGWTASSEASQLIRDFMTCEKQTISAYTAENQDFSVTQREHIRLSQNLFFLAPNNDISN